jgi:hypothetical protein
VPGQGFGFSRDDAPPPSATSAKPGSKATPIRTPRAHAHPTPVCQAAPSTEGLVPRRCGAAVLRRRRGIARGGSSFQGGDAGDNGLQSKLYKNNQQALIQAQVDPGVAGGKRQASAAALLPRPVLTHSS